MIDSDLMPLVDKGKDSTSAPSALMTSVRFASRLLLLAALGLFAYGLAWNFSNRRYLKGFADAIIPLTGSPQQKTEALVAWFHHEPQRNAFPAAADSMLLNDRDPVHIVQDERLLKICGSSSNAFMNLAVAAGLHVRRLLLVNEAGETMHVVAEVEWGDRWVVVNPQQGLIFKDQAGHALTKEELRDPRVFEDAISRMPGYDPEYTFEHTIHIRLKRIPLIGGQLRRGLDRFLPGWEETFNWAYFPENPTLWLMVISLPLFLLGYAGIWLVNRSARYRREAQKAAEPSHT